MKKEQSERLRDVYLIGDIEKDVARVVIERIRELANEGPGPITLYMNTAGGNVTDGLAIHDAILDFVSRGIEVTVVVQGMAYSMGSVILQAASAGCRYSFPHSWIMIHEPAKWAGWQSTTAAAQHLDRLKQMQSQIYRILSGRSGRPLKQIIRDTKRTDFYLDATKALEYGLIDQVLGVTHASTPVLFETTADSRAEAAAAFETPDARTGPRRHRNGAWASTTRRRGSAAAANDMKGSADAYPFRTLPATSASALLSGSWRSSFSSTSPAPTSSTTAAISFCSGRPSAPRPGLRARVPPCSRQCSAPFSARPKPVTRTRGRWRCTWPCFSCTASC